MRLRKATKCICGHSRHEHPKLYCSAEACECEMYLCADEATESDCEYESLTSAHVPTVKWKRLRSKATKGAHTFRLFDDGEHDFTFVPACRKSIFASAAEVQFRESGLWELRALVVLAENNLLTPAEFAEHLGASSIRRAASYLRRLASLDYVLRTHDEFGLLAYRTSRFGFKRLHHLLRPFRPKQR